MPLSKTPAKPPGNTGTHIPSPNTYLLSQLSRVNFLTARRTPFTETPDNFATELQRHVHHEGKRPPNRRILFYLRLLTYYPPVHDVLPELIILLESDNVHVCRLAHYHVRQMAPIKDVQLYQDLLDTLERQSTSSSPARRACATKTFAKIFRASDATNATDFVLDVFNKIGGARVRKPVPPAKPKRIEGISLSEKEKKETFRDRAAAAFAQGKIVRGEVYEPVDPASQSSNAPSKRKSSRAAASVDDGAGGTIKTTPTKADHVSSRSGKMLVGHATIAALRRISRVAREAARVESYIFDSGLMSVVPSTVRHCVALLELRSIVSGDAVARYLLPRLPQKNPPPNMRLFLEDLGARVYFARILSTLAEDPNLSIHIPDEAPKQAKRDKGKEKPTLQSALDAPTVREKATQLFKFIFNRETVENVKTSITTKSTAVGNMVLGSVKPPRDESIGVEFAEALINLVKNASNRVLIEALRGLSKRKWATWFEAPIPRSALHNAPELQDDEEYGNDYWNGDDEDDDDKDGDSEDENELGAFENDIGGEEDDENAAGPSSSSERKTSDLKEPEPAEKENWFTKLSLRRKERREALTEVKTPFYLREVGEGMVPALEVILRRIYAGLLLDEPVRRFAAVDAVIVLSRAKIYGYSDTEQDKLVNARKAVQGLRITGSSSSQAVVTTGNSKQGLNGALSTSSTIEDRHPFQALVRPLAEMIEEDPSPFIRGRAAVALMFVVAAGAGRSLSDTDDLDVSEEALNRAARLRETPLLLRYFKTYVRHESAGSGIGLRQMSELVDYLVYEILDVAPDLAPSVIALAEEWANAHPTVGVCGRLGAVWEKVLALEQGALVGASLMRAMASDPQHERVAAAATIFLRRRTLDVAVLTVGATSIGASGLPEPLPRDVGVEMERYFSVLWHTALVGPSAECRSFAVDSLGGAAVLAGEPFRICTYERLLELVRFGGFGVRPAAERVLVALDTLYATRETFSETRAERRIPRDGRSRDPEWLALVWRLRCQASAAAQVALGVPPPPGWQSLGPSAAADVVNAELAFGQEGDGYKVASLVENDDTSIAPTQPVDTGNDVAPSLLTASRIGHAGPLDLSQHAQRLDNARHTTLRRERVNGDVTFDDRDSTHNNHRRRSQDDYEEYDHYRDREGYQRNDRRDYGDSRRDDRGDYDYRHDDYDDYRGSDQDDYDDYREPQRDEYDRYNDRDQRAHHERENKIPSQAQGSAAGSSRTKQEEEDRALAERLQKEEDEDTESVAVPGRKEHLMAVDASDMFSSAQNTAGRFFKQGVRGGKNLTDKVFKSAARSAAMDKLRGNHK